MIRRLPSTLIVAVALLYSTQAFAQVARVTTAQRSTEKSAGDGAWQQAGVGANLSASDRFRTGKRSKADLKFRDGSLVRLGQLSYLEMRGAKQMNLVRGQLLFVALKPGRVLAGAAAAAIKGSVALIQYRNYKNSEGEESKVAEFYLYSGAMDIITALGTISLAPGQMVTVFPDGTYKVGVAPPLEYFGGEKNPVILEKPGKFVFVGSPEHQDWRDDPERIEREHNISTIFNPGGLGDMQGDAFPQPEPDKEPILEGEGFAAAARTLSKGSFSLSDGSNTLGRGNPSASALWSGALRGAVALPLEEPLRLAAAEPESRSALQTLEIIEDPALLAESGEFDLDASAAYAHLEEAERNLGRQIGGDIALLGAAANGGAYAYGARLHGYAAYDNWLLDAAYTPLRVHARFGDGSEKSTRDFSAITDLSLNYLHRLGDIQVGRQRFLSGPTQATLYGSLVRAGGREIMDAVRLFPRVGDNASLELAYLFDAFPNKLPYRISGNQTGFYARGATYQSYGNFGINVLRMQADVPDVAGVSVDFAIPVIRDSLEFYGEVGRDPYRRNLFTVGLTFPYVYERTGWDVFLEAAHLGDSRIIDGPPNEYTIRAYKKINNHLNVVTALSHFSGESTRFVVGFSLGARTSR